MTDLRLITKAMRDKSRTLGKSHALLAGMSEAEWLPLAEAALSALPANIEKLVPREPTDHMIEQGLASLSDSVERDALKSAWRVMYDHASTPLAK